MEPVILELYDGSTLVASAPLSGIWQNSDVSADGTAVNDVFTVNFENVVATKVRLYKGPGDDQPINFHELEAWGTFAVSHYSFVSPIFYNKGHFSKSLSWNTSVPYERIKHLKALVA